MTPLPASFARRHVHSCVVGFLGGGSVGLVGWGGAQCIIPGMTHPTMSLSQLSATGISLCSLSLSSMASGYKFLCGDSVDISAALAIGIPSVLSARIGTRLAKQLSGDALSLIFNGLSILLIPTHLWIQEVRREAVAASAEKHSSINNADGKTNYMPQQKQQKIHGRTGTRSESGVHGTTKKMVIQHGTFGLVSGTLSALMGVGGLPLTMSYLTIATNLPHHLVQGTAICALVPSILTSAYSRLNAIPIKTAAIVSVGAVAGGVVGAQLALLTNDERLRQLYMLSLVLFGGRSILGAGSNIRNIWLQHFRK